MVRALNDFSHASGLHANKDKSTFYFGNVNQGGNQDRILQVTGFTKGTFPFRYLSVDISARKLSVADCDLLVDRIIKKILCWASRHLSYAARNVLVNSVLLLIHTY